MIKMILKVKGSGAVQVEFSMYALSENTTFLLRRKVKLCRSSKCFHIVKKYLLGIKYTFHTISPEPVGGF